MNTYFVLIFASLLLSGFINISSSSNEIRDPQKTLEYMQRRLLQLEQLDAEQELQDGEQGIYIYLIYYLIVIHSILHIMTFYTCITYLLFYLLNK